MERACSGREWEWLRQEGHVLARRLQVARARDEADRAAVDGAQPHQAHEGVRATLTRRGTWHQIQYRVRGNPANPKPTPSQTIFCFWVTRWVGPSFVARSCGAEEPARSGVPPGQAAPRERGLTLTLTLTHLDQHHFGRESQVRGRGGREPTCQREAGPREVAQIVSFVYRCTKAPYRGFGRVFN